MDHVLAIIQIEGMNEEGRDVLTVHDRRITALASALRETNTLLRASASSGKLRNVLMLVRISMTQRHELRRLKRERMRYIWNYVPV